MVIKTDGGLLSPLNFLSSLIFIYSEHYSTPHPYPYIIIALWSYIQCGNINDLTWEPVAIRWLTGLQWWMMILVLPIQSTPSNLHTLPMHWDTHECAVTKSRGYLMVILVSTPWPLGGQAMSARWPKAAVTHGCPPVPFLPPTETPGCTLTTKVVTLRWKLSPILFSSLRPQIARWQQRLWLLGSNSALSLFPLRPQAARWQQRLWLLGGNSVLFNYPRSTLIYLPRCRLMFVQRTLSLVLDLNRALTIWSSYRERPLSLFIITISSYSHLTYHIYTTLSIFFISYF